MLIHKESVRDQYRMNDNIILKDITPEDSFILSDELKDIIDTSQFNNKLDDDIQVYNTNTTNNDVPVIEVVFEMDNENTTSKYVCISCINSFNKNSKVGTTHIELFTDIYGLVRFYEIYSYIQNYSICYKDNILMKYNVSQSKSCGFELMEDKYLIKVSFEI